MEEENIRLNLKITQTEDMLVMAQCELEDAETTVYTAKAKAMYFIKMLEYLKAEREG